MNKLTALPYGKAFFFGEFVIQHSSNQGSVYRETSGSLTNINMKQLFGQGAKVIIITLSEDQFESKVLSFHALTIKMPAFWAGVISN